MPHSGGGTSAVSAPKIPTIIIRRGAAYVLFSVEFALSPRSSAIRLALRHGLCLVCRADFDFIVYPGRFYQVFQT